MQWIGNCYEIKRWHFCADMHGFQHLEVGCRNGYDAEIVLTYMMIDVVFTYIMGGNNMNTIFLKAIFSPQEFELIPDIENLELSTILTTEPQRKIKDLKLLRLLTLPNGVNLLKHIVFLLWCLPYLL